VIQEVMGWENCHLHTFRFKDREYGIPDPEFPTDMRSERGRRLSEFLREEGETFGYQYDFGDDWERDVVVERIVTDAEVTEAVCLAGERACPPEDVGGPPGYMDYLEAMRDPSHPDHEQMVEWRGPSFDPERFDPAGINRRLSLLSRSRRGLRWLNQYRPSKGVYILSAYVNICQQYVTQRGAAYEGLEDCEHTESN